MPIDLEAPEVKAAIEEAVNKQVTDKIAAETGGLKSKNTELMDELKGFKKKFEGIDPDEVKRLREEDRNKQDKDSDPAKLRERIEGEYAPKLTEAEKRAEAAEAKLNSTIIDSQLTSALGEAGVAKEFLRAVKADLSSSRKVEVNDGGVMIDGKPVGDFVKTWSTTDGKPFISAGDNTGGGGKSGGGGGATSKKVSEMTVSEKAAAMRELGADAYRQKVNNEQKAQ
ncbi:hypothetical protein U8C35_06445 [Sinorhizobium medicae]|uniref:hypothetical protein n=1 Tax=Sinorhizobium medicae TaxID=110321 RepID=UPI002AF6B3EA|nr:hypothetical protein [Sinorhizobium medicae]WQO60072.1 hypothetical protein U8C35_06445 [Sinorhizobium medicae]